MGKPQSSFTLLELHTPDFQKVKDYYGKLGFKIVWERKPEGFKGYLVMSMGGNILCFWAGNEKVYKQDYFKKFPKKSLRGYGVELVLMVDNIDEYYKRVRSFANVYEELRLRPWGLRDFRTIDPFGFYLRFTSKHDIFDPKHAVP